MLLHGPRTSARSGRIAASVILLGAGNDLGGKKRIARPSSTLDQVPSPGPALAAAGFLHVIRRRDKKIF
jgi:hypothetical protein